MRLRGPRLRCDIFKAMKAPAARHVLLGKQPPDLLEALVEAGATLVHRNAKPAEFVRQAPGFCGRDRRSEKTGRRTPSLTLVSVGWAKREAMPLRSSAKSPYRFGGHGAMRLCPILQVNA